MLLQLLQRRGGGLLHLSMQLNHQFSGVTKVDVTRCGNWRCHPKKWRPFFQSSSSENRLPFILLTSSPLPPSPPSNIVCPVFYVNSNSAANNFIWISPTPTGGVNLGGTPLPPCPPNDTTASVVHRSKDDAVGTWTADCQHHDLLLDTTLHTHNNNQAANNTQIWGCK